MTQLRALFEIESIRKAKDYELLEMRAAGDETQNSFARKGHHPGARLELVVKERGMWGQFQPGQRFFVDFIPEDAQRAVEEDAGSPAA